MKHLQEKTLDEIWDLLKLLWANENKGQDLFEPSGAYDTENLYYTCIGQGMSIKAIAKYCSDTLRDAEKLPMRTRRDIVRMNNIGSGQGDIYPVLFDNILLVGVCGQIGAGKSYVSNKMSNELNCAGSAVLSFANSLKKLCHPALPLDIQSQLDEGVKSQSSKDLVVDKDLTVRCVYKKVGAAIRKKDPHYFIRQMYVTFEAHNLVTDEPFVYFIDDLRFQNEYDWIKQNGGIVLKVSDSTQELCKDRDLSEQDWKTWQNDVVVENPRGKNDDSFTNALEFVCEKMNNHLSS